VNTGVVDNNGIALYSENGVQIVLSPLTGLVQRDAEGNEFYGLIYDEIIDGFPQYNEKQYVSKYIFQDNDIRKEKRETKTETDEYTGTWNYYRYIYWYEHNNAYWAPTVTLLNQGYSKKVIQLPDTFKNKKWVIRVEQVDFDFSNFDNFNRYYEYHYDTTVPECHDGNKVVGEWRVFPDILGYDLDAIKKLESMSGVPSPYYTEPEIKNGTSNLKLSQLVLNSMTIKTDFTWEYDEENAKVTINVMCNGKHYSDNYNLNEFARFRVYVVC
jgi:hypothetical protein